MQLVRIPMLIAGAWIGGTVNNTGNVVAAAAILDDEEAEEVAAIVKMMQNAMIGVITVIRNYKGQSQTLTAKEWPV